MSREAIASAIAANMNNSNVKVRADKPTFITYCDRHLADVKPKVITVQTKVKTEIEGAKVQTNGAYVDLPIGTSPELVLGLIKAEMEVRDAAPKKEKKGAALASAANAWDSLKPASETETAE
jgi:hypothetical protein